jgi:preprotein translocase subunit SecD
MLEFARWKYVLVTLVVLIGLLFALPNLFGEDPALQVERKKPRADGRFCAPVDRGSAAQTADCDQARLHRWRPADRCLQRRRLAAQGARYGRATLSDVDRSALANAARAPSWMRKLGLKAMPLGLDLRGGLYLLYQVDLKGAVTSCWRAMSRASGMR